MIFDKKKKIDMIIEELVKISNTRKDKIQKMINRLFDQIVSTVSEDDYTIEEIIIALINLLAYVVMVGVIKGNFNKEDRIIFAKAIIKCIQNDLINFVKDENTINKLFKESNNSEKYIPLMYV